VVAAGWVDGQGAADFAGASGRQFLYPFRGFRIADSTLGELRATARGVVERPATPTQGQRWRNRATDDVLLLVSRIANLNRWRVSMERGGDSQVDEADLLANYELMP